MIAGAVIGAVIIGGAGFAGGMHYAQASRGGRGGPGAGNFQFVAGQGGRNGGTRLAGGGAAFGTILSKDAQSITVQLMTPGGPGSTTESTQGTGSKIVLVNSSTQISKSAVGTNEDLATGETVVVQGTSNSDGSITAQSIQIRPAGMGTRNQ